jgi:CHASE2 domain-containing sensor protein
MARALNVDIKQPLTQRENRYKLMLGQTAVTTILMTLVYIMTAAPAALAVLSLLSLRIAGPSLFLIKMFFIPQAPPFVTTNLYFVFSVSDQIF